MVLEGDEVRGTVGHVKESAPDRSGILAEARGVVMRRVQFVVALVLTGCASDVNLTDSKDPNAVTDTAADPGTTTLSDTDTTGYGTPQTDTYPATTDTGTPVHVAIAVHPSTQWCFTV